MARSQSPAPRRTPRLLAGLFVLGAVLLGAAPAHAGGSVAPGYDCPQPTWKWKGAPVGD